MRLGTILVIVLVLIAAYCLYKNKVLSQENFFPGDSLQVTWAPSGPNSQNIAYNWGVCISQGSTPTPQGQCSTQTPPYPSGPPGPGWNNHGQTPRGQNSLTLNNLNCSNCNPGQILTLMLQAVDTINPTNPTSPWAVFTLDLTSKATAVKATINDSTAPTEPIYPGSTGFIYTLQLNQPAFASPNISNVQAFLARGSGPTIQFFRYADQVPFTNISPDNTTGTYAGSFTATGPWAPSTPGPLQLGDVLTITPLIYSPGTAQQNGEIYFSGSLSQTATTITPTTPTGVIWNLT